MHSNNSGIDNIPNSKTNHNFLRQQQTAQQSFVSRYENHFDVRRSTDEDTSNQEFEIDVNGPNRAHCDTFVKEAMDQYWTINPRMV